MLAGEKSNRYGAAQAACTFLGRALDISEKAGIPLETEKEVRLHSELATAYEAIGAIGDAVNAYKKVIDLNRKYGMIDEEKNNLFCLTNLMRMWPVQAEAEIILAGVITRVNELGDKLLETMCRTLNCLAIGGYGQIKKMYQLGLEAEKLALEEGDPKFIFATRFLRATHERWIGRPRKTVELTEGLVESALSIYNIMVLSMVIQFRGIALAEIGQIENGIASLNKGIDICEKFGVYIFLGSLINCLGYCYGEIYQEEEAWKNNLKSEEIALRLLKKYPMGRKQWAHALAQAETSLAENLLDQGNIDEAWTRIRELEKKAKGEEFNNQRLQWESRMNYIKAQILLRRNELSQAEKLIQENLQMVRKDLIKKREGSFLRVLGEVQVKRNEHENAITTMNEGIHILKEVGNPRQLWQAYTSFASALDKMGRHSDAQEQWGAALEVVQNTAKGLSDRDLRNGFFNAEQIRVILSKAAG
jgi:tetratricopeptide (TPR) repeat protein